MFLPINNINAEINYSQKHKRSGNRKALKKIDKLLNELRKHPTTGTGKPEKTKYFQRKLIRAFVATFHNLQKENFLLLKDVFNPFMNLPQPHFDIAECTA